MLSVQAGLGQQVVVTPEETDELLANPGIGWETFHCTRTHDKTLPSWIPSTVHYARWGWGELEPQPGRLNTVVLDRVLKESRDAGQKLAFRVMCCSTDCHAPYHPRWLKLVGGPELVADYEGQGPLLIPDLDNPLVLKAHLDFIQRLGARYDGHPDLDHIDLGSIGWWGEWHLSGSKTCRLPALENRIKVVEAYLAAFRKTPLLMLIAGRECLTYAVQRGTGWRADCLGDMGGFTKTWCHMLQAYPAEVRLVPDAWKTAPVAWETCWDIRKWVREGWSLRWTFNYALACHASLLNNKSAPLPERSDVRPEIERFLRRLGYRLVLKELRHDARARAGGRLELSTKWQNVGSAPCYRPYRIAYRLSDDRGLSRVFGGGAAVTGWLPGSIDLFTPEFFREPKDLPPGPVYDVADHVDLPADLPAGRYTLSVAVVEESSAPVVRLAVKGRGDDGWYALSKVQVTR
jgi:hypothetical protein